MQYQPRRGCADVRCQDATPLGLGRMGTPTQGSAGRATAGLEDGTPLAFALAAPEMILSFAFIVSR